MTEELSLQHLGTEDDVAQHLELLRTVFGQSSGVDLQVKKWIDHHPQMTLKDFFVVKHRNKMVACLNLIPLRWSVGGILLKVAELGCVATLHEYRHRGLQRGLMVEYHKQLAEQGYDLSSIEGIPYYYRQFGYEFALPLLEKTVLKFHEIPEYKLEYVIRPFTKEDVPKAMELLGQSQQKFYVHSIRDKDVWKMQQETGMVAEYKSEGYTVERNGEMIAYFRINENLETRELLLREITQVDQIRAYAILSFLKGLGKQRSLKTLVALISYHEPFAAVMAAIGGMQNPPYAWQIRVVDYIQLFQKMKPLFEKRLASSLYCHLTEQLNFNFYRYTVQIAVENGEITDIQRLRSNEDRTIRFNPLVFVQLLFGYRNRDELEMIYPDFTVQPSHKHLVDVLFPKLPLYIHTDY